MSGDRHGNLSISTQFQHLACAAGMEASLQVLPVHIRVNRRQYQSSSCVFPSSFAPQSKNISRARGERALSFSAWALTTTISLLISYRFMLGSALKKEERASCFDSCVSKRSHWGVVGLQIPYKPLFVALRELRLNKLHYVCLSYASCSIKREKKGRIFDNVTLMLKMDCKWNLKTSKNH